LTLSQLAIAGRRFETVTVGASYDRHRLSFEDIFLEHAVTAESLLHLAGSYTPDTGLNIRAVANQVELSQAGLEVQRRLGLAAMGKLSGEAKVTGPLDSPQISFAADAAPLTLNGLSFENFSLEGSLKQGVLRLNSCILEQEGSEVSLSGKVDCRTAVADATLTLVNFDVATARMAAHRALWRLRDEISDTSYLATYARHSHGLGGRLSSKIHLAGPLRAPGVEVTDLLLEDLGFDGRTIEHIEGEFGLHLKEGEIGKLSLGSAHVDLTIDHHMASGFIVGTVSEEHDTNVRVEVSNLDLALLAPWLPRPMDLGGEATINFDVTGPLDRPDVRGDVFVHHPRLGGREIESAQISAIELKHPSLDGQDSGTLKMEGIRLADDEMSAIGQASVPLPSSDGVKTEQSRLPSGAIRVTNARLELLPGMVPVESVDIQAYLEGDLLILGDSGGPEVPNPEPGITGNMGSGRFEVSGKVELRRLHPAEWHQNHFNLTCEMKELELAVPGLQ
jgi:hypothetical protein